MVLCLTASDSGEHKGVHYLTFRLNDLVVGGTVKRSTKNSTPLPDI